MCAMEDAGRISSPHLKYLGGKLPAENVREDEWSYDCRI